MYEENIFSDLFVSVNLFSHKEFPECINALKSLKTLNWKINSSHTLGKEIIYTYKIAVNSKRV